MNYITLGKRKNPAVVFLHGWGGSINSFLGVGKVLAGFGFFVVIVDFMGFGESEEPKQPKTIYSYAGDVEKLIKDLNLENVSIVGHSFGGRIGIILASRGILTKLVLVDSAGIKPKRGLLYYLRVKKYKRLKKKVLKNKLDKKVLENYGSSDYKSLSPVMKASFTMVVNEDLTPLLGLIGCETLIVWGKKDKDTKMYMARILKRKIKKSRLVVYNAGHYSYLERLDKFISDLYEFLL